jgi:hypothetical protein
METDNTSLPKTLCREESELADVYCGQENRQTNVMAKTQHQAISSGSTELSEASKRL